MVQADSRLPALLRPLDDPEPAIERFNRRWLYRKDGRTPPRLDDGSGCTLRHLCNTFLTAKRDFLESGELSQPMFGQYYSACEKAIAAFGPDRLVDDLRADDFNRLRAEPSKGKSPVTVRNEIRNIRMVFCYAYDAGLVFLTREGYQYTRIKPNGVKIDSVNQQFDRLLRQLGLKRPRIGFFTLRHVFETIAGESRDQVAVDAVMDHVNQSMAGVYRERILDEWLRTVAETVRNWLWPDNGNGSRR